MFLEKIKGVIPPVITPFKVGGEVDYSAFESNILNWNDDKLAGYLIIGSNSETAFLNEEEKLNLVRIAVKNAAKNRHIMVGSGAESAVETIRLTNKCAELGADSALVLTPCYYDNAMSTKALIRFYTAVADASNIPILIYNVSKYTHVNISAEAIKELSRHPNIVGMKDSNGDVPQLVKYLQVADQSFQVMTGTFAAWYPALTLGITAIISAMANCFPNEIARVQELFDDGDWLKARELYQIMFDVNAAVTGGFGISGLKHVSTSQGYIGGYVRNPLLELEPAQCDKLDRIVNDAIMKAKESKLM